MLRSCCFASLVLLACAGCESDPESSEPPLTAGSTAASTGGGGAGGTGGAAAGGGDGIGGCTAQCESESPASIETLEILKNCIYCDACFDACAGDAGSACPNGREGGCSAQSASCGACSSSMCAWYYDGLGNYTGVCAAEYEGCDKDPSCFNLDKCLKDCGAR